MLTEGDSDRYEAVEDEGDGEENETGYRTASETTATQPETPGEPEVSEPTEPTVDEMVVVRNLTRMDVHILVKGDDGNETQVRLIRRSTYGPIARSRLTPQVESLQTNKHVRIESQN